MFSRETYAERRKQLKQNVESGILLFLGNEYSPMNYAGNPYPFRQDSTFLYYFGHSASGLAAIIDLDEDKEILFGYDFTVADIIWMGQQESMTEKAERSGVAETRSPEAFEAYIKKAAAGDRQIHFLPPYRPENKIKLNDMLNIPIASLKDNASLAFRKAVADQRNIKTDEEIQEMERALSISYEMNQLAMRISKPGLVEQEVYGPVEGLVLSRGSHVSFPVIFSVHGETLHNHYHYNEMRDGQLLVLDSGAESPGYYASDITRTFPVNGKFSEEQKDLYNIVLRAQMEAIAKYQPGVYNREIHLHAASITAEGLINTGFMKGNPEDAVASGAHALFFPHGLGHMIGLDVHDMEDIGEDVVGYDDSVKRSDQFGLAYLRFAKKLKPGMTVTVEPGLYFIPELMKQWKAENKHTDFINYDKAFQYAQFGGIRIEDVVLVTPEGNRVLGKPIAKTIHEVEEWCQG